MNNIIKQRKRKFPSVNIKIYYRGQLADLINSTTEEITIDSPISLIDLLNKLAKKKDATFNDFIFDENNNLRKSLLIAVDNNQVIDLSAMTIDRDCEITLFPPIAGG